MFIHSFNCCSARPYSGSTFSSAFTPSLTEALSERALRLGLVHLLQEALRPPDDDVTLRLSHGKTRYMEAA